MNSLKLFPTLLVGLISISLNASPDPIAMCKAQPNADSSTKIVLSHGDSGNALMEFFVNEKHIETDDGSYLKDKTNLTFIGNIYTLRIDITEKTALLESSGSQEELQCIIY